MGRSLRVRDIFSNRDLHTWLLSFAGENGFCIARPFCYERTWARICFKLERTAQGDLMTSADAFIIYLGTSPSGEACLKVRPLDHTPSLSIFFRDLQTQLAGCRKMFLVNEVAHNEAPEKGGSLSGPHLWHELIADADLIKLAIDPDTLIALSTRWSDRERTGGVISDQMQGIPPTAKS